MTLWDMWDFKGEFAVGVIDQRSDAIESVEEIARRAGPALNRFPPERLLLTSECGFQHVPLEITRTKLRALVAGARYLREVAIQPDPGVSSSAHANPLCRHWNQCPPRCATRAQTHRHRSAHGRLQHHELLRPHHHVGRRTARHVGDRVFPKHRWASFTRRSSSAMGYS